MDAQTDTETPVTQLDIALRRVRADEGDALDPDPAAPVARFSSAF